jgi:hypothetical protein
MIQHLSHIHLNTAAGENTMLKELMASGHALTPDALEAFAALLMKNKAITRLGLGNEKLGDEGMCMCVYVNMYV